MKKRGLPLTKENMVSLGDELRKKYGQDAVAQRLVDEIKKSGSETIVVSGVRSPEEVIYLKKHSAKFVLIKLVADAKKRIIRSGNANITARDNQDIKNIGLAKTLEMADITITNNGTLEEFYRSIDKMIESII